MTRHRVLLWLILLAGTSALGLLGGCSQPAKQFSQFANSNHMRREVVVGRPFQHVVFVRADRPARTLHVYVDGDGTPWERWGPADDPTPRNAIVLRLMALDPAPSLYLGRPCYVGLSDVPPCTTEFWTARRYSDAVVSSMEAVLRRFLAGTDYDRLIWFGYSGGGTLAMLLAPRFEATTEIVTVGANLDIDAWADLHGYTRLVGSLNPARQPPLPARIRQRHYVGGKDKIVPKEIVAGARVDPKTVIVVPSYDHVCCWEAMWPSVLSEVDPGGR